MQPSLFDHQEPAAPPPAAIPDKGPVTLPGHVEPQGDEACATDTGPGVTDSPRPEDKGLLHGGTGLSRGTPAYGWHPKPSAEAAAILKIARMSSIRAKE